MSKLSEEYLFTTSLVRELRGSPLTILVAILLLEQNGQVPVTAQLLKDVTGYGDHTITDALRVLDSPTRQIVTRRSGGWRLTVGFQLPLEFQNPGIPRENREKRDSLTTTTATTRLEECEGLPVEAAVIKSQNRDYRGFGPEQKAIYKILFDAGVGEPVRSDLTRSNKDPLFVLAHAIQAAYENIETGLLIHRIRYGDVPQEKYRRQAEKKLSGYFS